MVHMLSQITIGRLHGRGLVHLMTVHGKVHVPAFLHFLEEIPPSADGGVSCCALVLLLDFEDHLVEVTSPLAGDHARELIWQANSKIMQGSR